MAHLPIQRAAAQWLKNTAPDKVTDLRVIGAGRARAANKFQNEATILPSYRKSVHQEQTRNRPAAGMEDRNGRNGNERPETREEEPERTYTHKFQPRANLKIVLKQNHI